MVFCMWGLSVHKGTQGYQKPDVERLNFDFTPLLFFAKTHVVHSSNIYLGQAERKSSSLEHLCWRTPEYSVFRGGVDRTVT